MSSGRRCCACSIRRAVFLFEALVEIEDSLVGAIADGVNGHVKTGAVGGLQIGKKLIGLCEIFGGKAGVAGGVVERL